jgi:hypothetical protein
MLLERRKVSRKTPNDGRLEITKRAAAKFQSLGTTFDVVLTDARVPARLGTMDCTCRGVDNPHVHYFIESPALRSLAPGEDVDVHLDAEHKLVRIALASADE